MQFSFLSLAAFCCLIVLSSAQNRCINEPDNTFLPDPFSRERFIWCNGGVEHVGNCPIGQEFDPFDRVCEVPRWQPSTTTLAPRDICANQPDGTFLPDPSSRTRFIWCWNGVSIAGTCNNGQVFDPIDLVCDYERNPPVQTTTAQPGNPCWNQPEGTFLPDPSARNRFFWCSGGQAVSGSCPAGKFFDPQYRVCDFDNVITTTSRPQPENPCWNQPEGSFLPDPSARDRFFWCSGGQAVSGSCPAGQFFDPQYRFCDYDATTTKPAPTTTRTAAPPTRSTATTTTRAPAPPTRAPPAPGPTRAPPAPGPTRAPPAPPAPGPTRAPPAPGPTRAPPAPGPTRAPPAGGPAPPAPTRAQAPARPMATTTTSRPTRAG